VSELLEIELPAQEDREISDWGRPPQKIEAVHIKGRGVTYVKAITIGQYEAWVAKVIDAGADTRYVGKRNKGLKAELVARCLCHEDGNLVFPNLNIGLEKISAEPNDVVTNLYIKAKALNGDESNDTDELEKN